MPPSKKRGVAGVAGKIFRQLYRRSLGTMHDHPEVLQSIGVVEAVIPLYSERPDTIRTISVENTNDQ